MPGVYLREITDINGNKYHKYGRSEDITRRNSEHIKTSNDDKNISNNELLHHVYVDPFYVSKAE